MPEELHIQYPDKTIFQNGGTVLDVVKNPNPLYEVEQIEYRAAGGTLIHYKGRKYPTKGFVYPEAVHALNQAKGLIRSYLVLLTRAFVIPGVVLFLFLPFRLKIKILNRLLPLVLKAPHFAVSPHLLKQNFYLNPSNGIRFIAGTMAISSGLSIDIANKIADIFGAFIEYDNAYRWRIQDFFTELDRNKFNKTPKKELLRAIKVCRNRECEGLTGFWDLAKYAIIGLFLFLPKNLKTVFVELTTHVIDKKLLHIDEIDWYNMLDRRDYNFKGVSLDDRYAEYKKIHKNKMPKANFLV